MTMSMSMTFNDSRVMLLALWLWLLCCWENIVPVTDLDVHLIPKPKGVEKRKEKKGVELKQVKEPVPVDFLIKKTNFLNY